MNKLAQHSNSRNFCCPYAMLLSLKDEGRWKSRQLLEEFPDMSPRTVREIRQRFRRGEIGCEGLLACQSRGSEFDKLPTDLSRKVVQPDQTVLQLFSQEAVQERWNVERAAALERNAKDRQMKSEGSDPGPQR
jgi:hypothetical protein